MYLVNSDIDLEHQRRGFKSRNQDPARILDAFQRSGRRQVQLVFTRNEYKNAYSCRSTFANAITRMNIPHIQVRTLNGKVYLINTLVKRGVGHE